MTRLLVRLIQRAQAAKATLTWFKAPPLTLKVTLRIQVNMSIILIAASVEVHHFRCEGNPDSVKRQVTTR
jgi:hypothetical protein